MEKDFVYDVKTAGLNVSTNVRLIRFTGVAAHKLRLMHAGGKKILDSIDITLMGSH